MTDAINRMQSSAITLVSKEREARQTAFERLQKAIGEGSGFYETEEVQEDGSVILYRHDKPTMAESSLVFRFDSDSVGFSTDGGQTYPYGITIDGAAVMDIIEANGISADWVQFGEHTITEELGSIKEEMSNFSVTNEKIQSEVSQVKSTVDNLEIGSRNYIRNSRTLTYDDYSLVSRGSDTTAYVGSATVGTSTASGTVITAAQLNGMESNNAAAATAIDSVKTEMGM